MTRVALIVNPVSPRARRAVAAVRAACQGAGLEAPLVLETTIADPGPPQARYAVAQGYDRVVVVGGDGTARLVAGALAGPAGQGTETPDRGQLDTTRPEGQSVCLGVVPTGTANLFARSARLSKDLRAAARLAVRGEPRPTDLGQALLLDEDGVATEHPFLVVAGLGQDAETLAAVTPASKARTRWLAYFGPGLVRLRRPGHRLTVTSDGQPLDAGPLWSLLAVNAARLPAGAHVVPGARLDDGLLHLVLVSPRGLLGWARVASTGLNPWLRAYPRDHRSLAYRSSHHLVVDSDEPVLAQVDGDVVGGVVQARLRIVPGGLLVAR